MFFLIMFILNKKESFKIAKGWQVWNPVGSKIKHHKLDRSLAPEIYTVALAQLIFTIDFKHKLINVNQMTLTSVHKLNFSVFHFFVAFA